MAYWNDLFHETLYINLQIVYEVHENILLNSMNTAAAHILEYEGYNMENCDLLTFKILY